MWATTLMVNSVREDSVVLKRTYSAIMNAYVHFTKVVMSFLGTFFLYIYEIWEHLSMIFADISYTDKYFTWEGTNIDMKINIVGDMHVFFCNIDNNSDGQLCSGGFGGLEKDL